jgi:SMC interacting uncharacterized protein involved in chromosome segregation
MSNYQTITIVLFFLLLGMAIWFFGIRQQELPAVPATTAVSEELSTTIERAVQKTDLLERQLQSVRNQLATVQAQQNGLQQQQQEILQSLSNLKDEFTDMFNNLNTQIQNFQSAGSELPVDNSQQPVDDQFAEQPVDEPADTADQLVEPLEPSNPDEQSLENGVIEQPEQAEESLENDGNTR